MGTNKEVRIEINGEKPKNTCIYSCLLNRTLKETTAPKKVIRPFANKARFMYLGETVNKLKISHIKQLRVS